MLDADRRSMDDGGDKSVLLRIEFNPDGSLASNPTVKRAPSNLMAEYAIRAVIRCAPYGDVLPPRNTTCGRSLTSTSTRARCSDDGDGRCGT